VFGTGGVGGYFGGRLAAAGEDVRFVARGRHLEALRQGGLRVRSALGDLHLDPVSVFDNPADAGPADLVIISVKLYDTDAAAAGCRPMLGPDTAVVSLQNGVTAASELEPVVGADRVFGGTAYIQATIAEPGVIAHAGTLAKLVFGEFDGRRTPRVEAFVGACERAGIDAAISDDICGAIWAKFTFLTALSGVTTLLRLPVGPIRSDPDTRDMFHDAVDEAVAVARSQGVCLPNAIVDRHMKTLDTLAAEAGSSMLHDLSEGRRLELAWLSGTVVRIGRAAGVPTPTHAAITAALKLHAGGTS